MPKPLLKNISKTENDLLSTAKLEVPKTINTNPIMLNRILRKKRSKKYIDIFHKLDTGGNISNEEKIREIKNIIEEEFSEIDFNSIGMLLGVISVCYLGEPYEVHTLDFTGNIITHYKKNESLPSIMEGARNLALRGGYKFIEIYSDCYRAVSSNGAFSVIQI